MLQQIIEINEDETFLTADGFDDAVIGFSQGFNEPMRLIYSVKKCLNILGESMNEDDALEYFEFNVSNSYVGDATPIWCWDII
jgi:hypothetical protein